MSDASDDSAHERRSALIGFALAMLLTLAAFGMCFAQIGAPWVRVAVVGAMALVQVVVHLRFFLHLDLSRSRREDLQLILFALLLIILMVGGSLWILWSLQHRMMPMPVAMPMSM